MHFTTTELEPPSAVVALMREGVSTISLKPLSVLSSMPSCKMNGQHPTFCTVDEDHQKLAGSDVPCDQNDTKMKIFHPPPGLHRRPPNRCSLYFLPTSIRPSTYFAAPLSSLPRCKEIIRNIRPGARSSGCAYCWGSESSRLQLSSPRCR